MDMEAKIVLFAILATFAFIGGGVVVTQLQKPNCPLGLTAKFTPYKLHRGWHCSAP